MARMLLVVLLASPLALHCAQVEEQEQVNANPMRRVITMLEAMTAKIEAEGKEEKKLFDEFMCYCKGGEKELSATIQMAKTKIEDLKSTIESTSAELSQLKQDVGQAKMDRDAAKSAMAEATGIREKEAAEFA